MKPFILVGSGQYADYVQHLLEKSLGYEVVAFSVNRQYMPAENPAKNGRSRVCFEEMLSFYPSADYNVAIALLGADMYQTREKLFSQCLQWGYELPNIIHPSVIDQSEAVGIGNIIGAGTVFAPFCRIGNGNVFFDCSCVAHNSSVGDFNPLSGQIHPTGNTSIGSHCFVGAGSVIKNRVRLADYTLVGAMAYVTEDTKPYDVIAAARSIVLDGKNSLDFGQ